MCHPLGGRRPPQVNNPICCSLVPPATILSGLLLLLNLRLLVRSADVEGAFANHVAALQESYREPAKSLGEAAKRLWPQIERRSVMQVEGWSWEDPCLGC